MSSLASSTVAAVLDLSYIRMTNLSILATTQNTIATTPTIQATILKIIETTQCISIYKGKTTFFARHLGFWGPPSWNFAWLTCFFKRVGFEEYMYQISCLYHHLKTLILTMSAKLKMQTQAICCISRTVMDIDMYLVPKYPQYPHLYSTLIYLWGLKSMHFDL